VKSARFVALITLVLFLTLALGAQLPPQNQPPSNAPQTTDERFEAAHGQLFSNQDKAKDASRLTEAVAGALPNTGASSVPVARKNFVDEFIFGRMERDHIPHALLSGDAEFLRRAYLDATGLLPTPDEVRSFLADTDPNKRDKLIDSLIGTDAFADQWAYHYGELFRTDDASFHLWTKEWIKVDRPYNDVFYDIVTPVTKNAKGLPAAQYYDPTAYISNRCVIWTDSDHLKGFNRLDWIDEITSDIGRVFLGITMDCFSCHNGAGHADSVNLFLAGMRRTDF